jgi:tetrahydromethanopterin S-methyltransferase subunit G
MKYMKKEPQKTNLADEHVVEELTESLHDLENRLERVNKPSRNFLMGMLSGFGGAIGATVLIGLLIGLFSWLSYQTKSFPKINSFITGVSEEIGK